MSILERKLSRRTLLKDGIAFMGAMAVVSLVGCDDKGENDLRNLQEVK